MDNFEKLAKLVGAPAEEAKGAELPKSYGEAKALGALMYFTGKTCKYGHTAKRYTSNGYCTQCVRLYNAKPENKEAMRLHDAKPERKKAHRLNAAKPENKEAQRLRNMEKTGDVVLFSINQAERAAVSGRTPTDIVTQCPEPQRSQLQGLIDRIRADPKAGKAVIALLRTMRELRKTELAEAIFEVTKD